MKPVPQAKRAKNNSLEKKKKAIIDFFEYKEKNWILELCIFETSGFWVGNEQWIYVIFLQDKTVE